MFFTNLIQVGVVDLNGFVSHNILQRSLHFICLAQSKSCLLETLLISSQLQLLCKKPVPCAEVTQLFPAKKVIRLGNCFNAITSMTLACHSNRKTPVPRAARAALIVRLALYEWASVQAVVFNEGLHCLEDITSKVKGRPLTIKVISDICVVTQMELERNPRRASRLETAEDN
ncbi:hypothetical protein J6590_050778 [Homalodisca vitripennis]|nr:hypothetical protein J6590_050778 [Homalodisca vitripennis]